MILFLVAFVHNFQFVIIALRFYLVHLSTSNSFKSMTVSIILKVDRYLFLNS